MDLDRIAQELHILLESPRDRRALEFLLGSFGEESLREARQRLQGDRRPFVSNIAKALGAKIPPLVETSNSEVADQELKQMKAILRANAGQK